MLRVTLYILAPVSAPFLHTPPSSAWLIFKTGLVSPLDLCSLGQTVACYHREVKLSLGSSRSLTIFRPLSLKIPNKRFIKDINDTVIHTSLKHSFSFDISSFILHFPRQFRYN